MGGNREMKKGNKKAGAAVIALVCAIILLMSGTYAWFDTINAVNEFDGENIIYDNDVVLHDHFVEEQNEDYIKEIFVENTGEDSLFVRLRLDEYMKVDGSSTIDGAIQNDLKTWHRHNYDGGSCVDCGQQFHVFWEWTMGGENAVQYLPSEEHERGVINKYKLSDSEAQKWEFTDPEEGAWTNAGEECEVITMEEYQQYSETAKESFTGWILDEDAYAYWSQKLESEQATGQLLSKVKKRAEIPGKKYYYAINVTLEAVDEEDVLAWVYGTDIVKVNEVDDNGGEPVNAASEKSTKEAAELLKSISSRNLDADYYKRIIKEAEESDVVEIDGAEWIIVEKSDSAAKLLRKDCLADGQLFANSVVTTPWQDSKVREYLNTTYYNSLNEGFQSMILPTWIETKKYYLVNEYETYREDIYIPSEEELLAWFEDEDSARIAYRNNLNSAVNYWTRTPANENKIYYRYVKNNGEIASTANSGTTISSSLYMRPVVNVTLY